MNYKYAGFTSLLYLAFQIVPSQISGHGVGFLLLITIFPYLLFRLKHLLNNKYEYRFADLPITIVILALLIGFLLFALQILFINYSSKIFGVVLFVILFTRGTSYILLGLTLTLKGRSLLSMRFWLLGYIFTFFGSLQVLSGFPNLMFILPKAIGTFAKGYFMIYINTFSFVTPAAQILLFGCLAYIFLSNNNKREDL